jgi:hypothetical protein
VLTADDGLGARAGEFAPAREHGREQRCAIFRRDDTICREIFRFGQQRLRIELRERIEIAAERPHAVTALEPGRCGDVQIALLRPDEEHVAHAHDPTGHPSYAKLSGSGRDEIPIEP